MPFGGLQPGFHPKHAACPRLLPTLGKAISPRRSHLWTSPGKSSKRPNSPTEGTHPHPWDRVSLLGRLRCVLEQLSGSSCPAPGLQIAPRGLCTWAEGGLGRLGALPGYSRLVHAAVPGLGRRARGGVLDSSALPACHLAAGKVVIVNLGECSIFLWCPWYEWCHHPPRRTHLQPGPGTVPSSDWLRVQTFQASLIWIQ